MKPRKPLHRVVALLTMSLVACSSGASVESVPDSTTPVTSATPTTLPGPTIPDTTIPDTDVGREAQWVLGLLTSERDPAIEEVEERFAATILADVPPVEFSASLPVLRNAGPFEVVSYVGDGANAEIGLQGGDGQRLRTVIGLTVQ